MQQSPTGHWARFGNWLHALPDWQFTGVLYLLRWPIVVSLAWALSPLASSADAFQSEGDPWRYLIPFLIVAPVLETLIECSLIYWILYKVLKLKNPSPWPFVFLSASIMVVLHPLVPRVVVLAFVTGSFLAYVYYRFAPESHGKAILHTAVFHAGINIVEWSILMWTSMM